jgi:hypothetical protein
MPWNTNQKEPFKRVTSPVFEQLNLERLKSISQSVRRAEEAIKESEKQLEKSNELLNRRKGK